MATLFGKETFEGGSLPASFTSQATSGGATGTIDTTSKVTGANSFKLSATASGTSLLVKDLGTNYTELYIQFKIFVPTAFAYGSASTFIPLELLDSASTLILDFKLQDYGTQEVVLQGGTMAYTDTTLTITKNVVHKVEFYFKVGASTGAYKVWIDNDVVGSPNASASAINTGTALLRQVKFGNAYSAAAYTDSIYLDEFIVADAFIGAGTVATPSNLFFGMFN